MTMQPGDVIPQWTFGDRLRKARLVTGLTSQEFADRLGVARGTVTAAENDKHRPRRIVVNAWALATGVPLEWLNTGEPEMHSGPTSPRAEKPAQQQLPRLDSNQQPSGYTLSLVSARVLGGSAPRPVPVPAPEDQALADVVSLAARRAS